MWMVLYVWAMETISWALHKTFLSTYSFRYYLYDGCDVRYSRHNCTLSNLGGLSVWKLAYENKTNTRLINSPTPFVTLHVLYHYLLCIFFNFRIYKNKFVSKYIFSLFFYKSCFGLTMKVYVLYRCLWAPEY